MDSASTLERRSSDRTAVDRLIEGATRRLATRACAVLVRSPAIDAGLPETSDLDFLAFTEASDLYPERLGWNGDRESAGRPIDVTWLPSAWLDDPRALAARGLIAHRLLTSDLALPQRRDAARCRSVTSAFHERRSSSAARPASSRWMATVRRSDHLGFPGAPWCTWLTQLAWRPASRLGRPCPNVYTRPLDYFRRSKSGSGEACAPGSSEPVSRPGPSLAKLLCNEARHAVAAAPEPSYPLACATARASSIAIGCAWELRWRVSAAEEMCRRGQAAAAVYYLRFYAYALARAPMVHARAREGRDVSYLRPERAVLPDLQRLCPEVIDDLNVVFAGTSSATVEPVERALAAVHELREGVVGLLRSSGLPMPALVPWVPHELPRTG
jgi:hypothetical protein